MTDLKMYKSIVNQLNILSRDETVYYFYMPSFWIKRDSYWVRYMTLPHNHL